ncbi:MAG: hypothetical protein PHT80_12925 [Lentisphaeria bacterium]|nr:hypothetical protein [Lentisphaeria bacterium]
MAKILVVLLVIGAIIMVSMHIMDSGSGTSDWRPRRDRVMRAEQERAQVDAQREITAAHVFQFVSRAIADGRDVTDVGRFSLLQPEQWSQDGVTINDTSCDLEECSDLAEIRSQAILQERFPAEPAEAMTARLALEAERQYAMYKIGDRVNFVIRGGIGPGSTVEGMLIDVTEERVRVGSRLINRIDMDDETQARFYTDVNERVKKNVVIMQSAREQAIRANRLDEIRCEVYPPVFTAAGFIPDVTTANSDWHSGRADAWIAPKALAEKVQAALLTEASWRYFRENMAGRGYVFTNAGAGVQEWVPERVLRKLSR